MVDVGQIDGKIWQYQGKFSDVGKNVSENKEN